MTPETSLSAAELKALEGALLPHLRDLAEKGLSFFHGDLQVERKRDRTLVSEADRSIELHARALLARLTPELGFVGEEFGRVKRLSASRASDPAPAVANTTEGLFAHEHDLSLPVEEPLNLNEDRYWLLDPIDGTINFLARSPLWTTLLALIDKGTPVLGVVLLPALGEIFVASRGNGARWGRLNASLASLRPCRTRTQSPSLPAGLAGAHISCSSPKIFAHRAVEGFFTALTHECLEMRTHSDAYGYTRVLCGGIDAMLDPIVAPYDVAALQVLFDETPGAVFTTLHGHRGPERYQMGTALGAASEALAQEILTSYDRYLDTRAQAQENLRPSTLTFAEDFLLSAELPAGFAPRMSQTDSAKLAGSGTRVWLEALEIGVSRFRRSRPENPLIEDVSIIARDEESFRATLYNGGLETAPAWRSAQGIQVRAVVAGGTGLVTATLPVSAAPWKLVLRTLELAWEESREMGLPATTSHLAYRDHIIGRFDAEKEDAPAVTATEFRAALRVLEAGHAAKTEDGEISVVESSLVSLRMGSLQLFLDGSQQVLNSRATRISTHATAVRGEEKRNCSARRHRNSNLSPADLAALHEEALGDACDAARRLLDAELVPESVDYDYLAIDADLAGLILHEAVGHAAEGDLVQTRASGFGHEGRLADLEVAPPWMNILIDASLDNCGYVPIDAEGTPALRKAIVRGGKLVEALQTRETARALGGVPDGCSRMESVFHPPLNRMTSIWIQTASEGQHTLPLPGVDDPARVSPAVLQKTLEDNGILTAGKRVLFLSGWKGGTATCSNLEFRADVERVHLLRAGAPPLLMREANFTGVATACFRSTEKVLGPLLCRSVGTCYKDGQSLLTSDGGPALLLLRKDPAVKVIGTGEDDEQGVGHS